MDGNHSAWFILEAENKEEARLVVPPQFRAEARVIGLNKFTIEQMEAILSQHSSQS